MKKYFVTSLVILVQISNPMIGSTSISLTNPKSNWTAFFTTLQNVCKINTFVETGTYLGDTTALAAQVFPTVHTIELLPFFYQKAVERFQYNPEVSIYLGDSATIFPKLLPTLATPANKVLFWLDGHVMDCQSENESEFSKTEFTPIMQELINIKNNNFEKDIILIDDLRLFGSLLNNQRIQLAGRIEYPLLADVYALLNDTYTCKVYGDVLLAYEKSLQLSFSPVIDACTMSRIFDGTNYSTEEILNAEQIIAQAQGEELKALHSLYKDFSAPWRQWYNKSPHYNLWYGLILQNQNDHENACLQFQEVIRLGYNHWRVFWYLANSLYERQNYTDAINALNIVLQNNPNFEPGQTLLATLNE